MSIATMNPATQEQISEYPEMTTDRIDDTVRRAHWAFLEWRDVEFSRREELMRGVAEILRQRRDNLAELMTAEMGKPLAQARAEIEKCAWVCEYYADKAVHFLRNEEIETDARRSYVTFQPLGVVLAVMPWNFPFWQVFRFLAPALMAGNAAVLKHASNVMGCSLAISDVIREAGFPPDLFHSLLIGSDKVDQVIAHPLVRAVTLTGSTPAGRAVASKAGECLKKTVLELGGSDPYIILADADVDRAAKTCVTSRMINSGQSCIAAKRFIVVEDVKSQFEKRVIHYMKAQVMGDPLDERSTLGPLARIDLRDDLHRQVQESVDQGAQLLFGGFIPEKEGAYYPPTILTDVSDGMPAFREELFGPVAVIISVRDEKDAIAVANHTSFGLGAAVFTHHTQHGEEIAARRLDAGCCFVNDFVKSDPRLPFGGIKESGYGRELAAFGIREFVNIKTVYLAD